MWAASSGPYLKFEESVIFPSASCRQARLWAVGFVAGLHSSTVNVCLSWLQKMVGTGSICFIQSRYEVLCLVLLHLVILCSIDIPRCSALFLVKSQASSWTSGDLEKHLFYMFSHGVFTESLLCLFF